MKADFEPLGANAASEGIFAPKLYHLTHAPQTLTLLNRPPALDYPSIRGDALSAAMRSIATLLLMCDRRDIAWAVTDRAGLEAGPEYAPNIYLFDSYPGGIGLSEPLYQLHHRLLEQTERMITSCECGYGCPSCVGAPGESGERGKEVGLAVLAALRGRGLLTVSAGDNVVRIYAPLVAEEAHVGEAIAMIEQACEDLRRSGAKPQPS